MKIDHGQLGSICRGTSFDSEDCESSVQLCFECWHTSLTEGYGSSMQSKYVPNNGTHSLASRILKVVCNYVPNVGTHSFTQGIMKVV